MSVIATAPLVVVPDVAGDLRYYYAGAVIDELHEHDYERLIDDGMIVDTGPVVVEATEPDIAPDTVPDGDSGAGTAEQSDQAAETVAAVQQSDQAEAVVEVERPKQTALKETWVEYAVARGMTEADAEAMTRAELIQRLA